MKADELYTVKEVAQYLNVCARTVERWCWGQKIRYYRLPGDVIRIEGSVVLAMRVDVSQKSLHVTFPSRQPRRRIER
ncbi:excise, DNA binding domain, excisionase family [uncultured Caudovirales phage]|uniref:Excise, DNA binding domain, excisionase family n=1 Tax=uncultured Caudovirales phage TaxID=2100421 RepID=A0A6J7VL62_9CAUD|nr:excise, DNA binding domain, excisionase family [uncultured Caudovirales phage]